MLQYCFSCSLAWLQSPDVSLLWMANWLCLICSGFDLLLISSAVLSAFAVVVVGGGGGGAFNAVVDVF